MHQALFDFGRKTVPNLTGDFPEFVITAQTGSKYQNVGTGFASTLGGLCAGRRSTLLANDRCQSLYLGSEAPLAFGLGLGRHTDEFLYLASQ